MATKKLSKVAIVRQLLTQYPDMNPAEIASRAKCSKPTVYTTRWEMKGTVPQPVVTKPTVSVKEAIEVLARAVSEVDGLDIKVWGGAVLFDIDGSRYTATAGNASQVLDAIKLLTSHKFD